MDITTVPHAEDFCYDVGTIIDEYITRGMKPETMIRLLKEVIVADIEAGQKALRLRTSNRSNSYYPSGNTHRVP